MIFHELKNGMTVMDGDRLVATGKPTGRGWLLTLHGACWLHKRREVRAVQSDPKLLVVPYRSTARRELQRLTERP